MRLNPLLHQERPTQSRFGMRIGVVLGLLYLIGPASDLADASMPAARLAGLSAGFAAFVGLLKGSVESFASAEAAERKMAVALRGIGQATPEAVAQMNDLAGSFQQTTKYSDDLISEMQALLIQIGDVAPAEMEKALTAATDLASGLGIDLEQAILDKLRLNYTRTWDTPAGAAPAAPNPAGREPEGGEPE